jgi:uncharacterized protein (TIGR00255 family)
MTGYGRGESSEKGYKITVEVSTVNRRQSEISINLPRELEILEAQIRDQINEYISRGRVLVRVTLHLPEGVEKIAIDVGAAKNYVREVKKLIKELKLKDETISLDLILRGPGVLEPREHLPEAEELWPAVKRALEGSLRSLVGMREKEGMHLAKDLAARVSTMRKSVQAISKEAPKVAVRFREQLVERIRAAGLELPREEDERLTKEIVYFADRSDISEELTRLESHFKQFDDCLKSKAPVGRTLDFLSQEMNREINTIGSKANDSLISRNVVELKAELERFREQVQNVE